MRGSSRRSRRGILVEPDQALAARARRQAERPETAVPILETNMNSAKNSEQIRLERRTPSYWRVTFDHPPLNIFGPETIPQLNAIVTALETDNAAKVVVFDSAVEAFF